MADNITIDDAGGNDKIVSTDDVGGGVEVQRVKVQYGVDGTATDVSSAAGLPVTYDTGNLGQHSMAASVPVTVASDQTAVKVTNPTSAFDFYVAAQGPQNHDNSGTSNAPIRIAGIYNSSPSKVSTDGDVVNLRLTQEGKILDVHSTVAADTTNVNTNYSSAQTNASLVSAPGANKRLVIVEIVYSKDTAGNMKLVEDPSGTPSTKFGPHYFSNNGGLVATKTYIPLTTNKALGITTVGGGNETITLRTIVENV